MGRRVNDAAVIPDAAPGELRSVEASDGETLAYRFFAADPATRRGNVVTDASICPDDAQLRSCSSAKISRRIKL